MNLKLKYFFLSFLICVSITAGAMLQIWEDYNETKFSEETTIADISKIVESQVINTVNQTNNIAVLISESVFKNNPSIKNSTNLQQLNNITISNLLHSYCKALLGCHSIGIIDINGQSVISSIKNLPPINISDRLFFQTTVQTKQSFISPAIVTRVPGNPTLFHITKPILNNEGNLIAIIVVGIEVKHITEFYGLIGFGVNPTVSIFKGNGDILARYPHTERYIGKNLSKGALFAQQLIKSPQGIFTNISALDGKKRLAAYMTVKNLDLIIYTGIEEDIAFQDWKQRSLRLIYTLLATLIVVGSILYFAYKLVMQKIVLKQKNHTLKNDNDDLHDLAHFDSLTKIANRRTFDKFLQNAWQQHTQEKNNLSVLLIDVDLFKPYNDHYGHPQGDICLHKIAQTLQASLHREVDLVARYGGEEFVVVLKTNSTDAALVAQRMILAVENLQLIHEYSPIKPFVTISVGIASDQHAKTIDEIVSFADQALYNAKKNGKNQYFVYSE